MLFQNAFRLMTRLVTCNNIYLQDSSTVLLIPYLQVHCSKEIQHWLCCMCFVAVLPVDFHFGGHVNSLAHAHCLRETRVTGFGLSRAADASHVQFQNGAYFSCVK